MLTALLAIVPFKGPAGAKSRLAPLLSTAQRTELALAMLDDVLTACSESAAIEETLVVTPDRRLGRGDDLLLDEGAGHAAAIALALADPRARDGALVVMADCPLVQPESLDALVAAAAPIALAPARDGGLNALALRSPDLVEPAFGRPGAAGVTAVRAREAGVDAAVLRDPLLALDIDEPEDVERFHALILACA